MPATNPSSLSVSIPLYAWAALMFFLSSLPGSSFPDVGLKNADKVVHLFEFAVLAGLLYRYIFHRWNIRAINIVWISVSIGVGWGILDELHQLLVPNRTCAWQDLVADIAGVTVGVLCMHAIITRRYKLSA